MVQAKKTSAELTVSVTDTGSGWPRKSTKRLFKAFYQASGGIKGKTPGTGLGLENHRISIIGENMAAGCGWKSAGQTRKPFSFTLPIVIDLWSESFRYWRRQNGENLILIVEEWSPEHERWPESFFLPLYMSIISISLPLQIVILFHFFIKCTHLLQRI